MSIKKILCLSAIIIMFGAISAYADITGEVLYTDIGALIDDSPIESYNINDYTYVVAEDLVKYGFDVIWNGEERTLDIKHNVHKSYELALDKEKINIKKRDIPQRKHYCYVYSTDIKTYLDGMEIDAVNVDGRTMIQIDYLAQYGEFYYDDSRRIVELRIMKPSFEYGLKIAENKTDKVFSFYPGRYSRNVNYTGLLNEDGVPEGIGRVYDPEWMSETYAYWYSLAIKTSFYEEVRGIEETDSKSSRIYGWSGENPAKDTTINVYGKGDNPYIMECTGRYEVSRDYSRNGIYDNSYLYGFYVVNETYYDSDGMAINYTNGQEKRFTAVMADKRFAQIAYVKTDDGAVYASGFSGADEDTGWVSSGNPYKVFTKTNVSDFPEPPTKPAIENYTGYSAAEAAAYIRILSIDGTGNVYFERTPGAFAEVNREQSDGIDLSVPIKVFENAKYVNVQLADVGEVTATAYIPYFYVTDNDNVLWYWNYEYYMQNQIGNEYDENNGYIAFGRVEYIKKPVKIAENVLKAFGTEEKYLLKTDGKVVKLTAEGEEAILEDVADIDADMFGLNFVALKKDGTLWTWGKNQNGQCGAGHTDYVWNPLRIKDVYEPLY